MLPGKYMDCMAIKVFSFGRAFSVVIALTYAQLAASDVNFANTSAPGPLAVEPEISPKALFAQASDVPICDSPDPAQEVVFLTNIERFDNGGLPPLPPLKSVGELIESSYLHSVAMAERNFFAHCDLDTKKLPWTRMRDAGYDYNRAGENIAAGYSSPASVMSGWMNSSGHRANILNPNFREMGVGYYNYPQDTPDTRRDADGDCNADSQASGSYYRYWTQNFGARNSIYPVVLDLEAHMTDSRDVALYVYGEGWATEMRIRNNAGNWSPWMPYTSESVWTLDQGNGTQTVSVEIRNSYGTVRTSSDEICLETDEPVQLNEVLFKHDFEAEPL